MGHKFETEIFHKDAFYAVKLIAPYKGQWNYTLKDSIYEQDYKIHIDYDYENKFECFELDQYCQNCLHVNETSYCQARGPGLTYCMVKHLKEKLKTHSESQKGTRADAIIQIHHPPPPPTQ